MLTQKTASVRPALRSCLPQAISARPPAKPLRAVAEEVVASNGAVHTTGAVDFDELSDIIRMVHDTDIIELELKSKKFTLNLRKKEAVLAELAASAPAPPAQPMFMPPQFMSMPSAAPAAPAPAAPAPAAAAPAPMPAPIPAAPTKIKGVEITSPMAGTFYRSAAPGEPAFVKEGDKVKKGQTVGIIEAMKLMNEIEAEVSGEVVKVLADNGSPVTPGQPLILIKP